MRDGLAIELDSQLVLAPKANDTVMPGKITYRKLKAIFEAYREQNERTMWTASLDTLPK